MSTGEAALWNRIAESLAPGWSTVVDDGVLTGATPLSAVNTFIYVLDSCSGWVGVAGLSGQVAMDVVRETRMMPELMNQAGGSAIELIATMHDRGAVAGDSLTRQAVVAGLVALATTRTVDVVIDRQGNLAGHFLYIVHTPMHGQRIGRPVFRRYDRLGVMPTEVVLKTAADVTSFDLGPSGGQVGSDMKAAGGLRLCPQLDALLR